MADLFVSYASEDHDRVIRLVKLLERQWSVWWDRGNIPPGRRFDEVIAAALGEAQLVVVVWSHHAVASEWVGREAEEGRKRERIVPVRIDNVEVPLLFRGRQTIDLIDWDGVATDHPGILSLTRWLPELLPQVARVVPPPPSPLAELRKELLMTRGRQLHLLRHRVDRFLATHPGDPEALMLRHEVDLALAGEPQLLPRLMRRLSGPIVYSFGTLFALGFLYYLLSKLGILDGGKL